MPLTYKQIIKLSREFSTAHKILKNFGNGGNFNTVLHDQENLYRYPIMWMVDLPMPIEQGIEVFSFEVNFLVQVEQLDERENALMSTNENEAKSNMLQCAKDFLSYWAQDHSYSTLRVQETAQRNTLERQTVDNLWGAQITITFRQAYSYDKCIIPMTGITAPASPFVTITINGSAFTTEDCGGTENVIVKDDLGVAVGSKVGTEWIVPSAGGSNLYDILFDGVDTGNDVDFDGTNQTITLT